MNSVAYFLLFSGFLLEIGGTDSTTLTDDDIKRIIKKNESISILNSNSQKYHNLKLSEEGKLGKSQRSLTWRGVYNNETVAVKIFWDQTAYNHELNVFKALNATEYPNIEDHGIPRVYYYGKVLQNYNAIAMTLFEGTLEDRYQFQRKRLSELSILVIFKQAVGALEYLNSRKVLHNDIKPENIFLRGPKVFINDFHHATLNGNVNQEGFTEKFASSNVFAKQNRTALDDLESLVFTIWYVAGVPQDQKLYIGSYQPEGLVLFENLQKGKAKDKMLKKCKYFKNPIVQEAYKQITIEEIISRKPIPNYGRIYNVLTETIKKLNENSEQHQFEWVMESNNWLSRFIVSTIQYDDYNKWKKTKSSSING